MEKAIAFFRRPFRSGEMTAVDWFLFVGFLLAVMVAWKLILNHIAAEL